MVTSYRVWWHCWQSLVWLALRRVCYPGDPENCAESSLGKVMGLWERSELWPARYHFLRVQWSRSGGTAVAIMTCCHIELLHQGCALLVLAAGASLWQLLKPGMHRAAIELPLLMYSPSAHLGL
jgi:hypothetical protein